MIRVLPYVYPIIQLTEYWQGHMKVDIVLTDLNGPIFV